MSAPSARAAKKETVIFRPPAKGFVGALYPFIIAVFPALSLFSHNFSQLSVRVLFIPVAILLGLTLIGLFLIGKTVSSYPKAGLFLSLFWLWLFSYEPTRDILFNASDLKIYHHRYFMPIWLLLGLIGSVCILKIKSDLKNISSIGNVFAAVLLLSATLPLFRALSPKQAEIQAEKASKTRPDQSVAHAPDIYYIILDGYCGQKELKNSLGFDNSEFVAFLQSKGFWLVDNSYGNYSWTYPAISSTLNMEYLPLDTADSSTPKFLAPDIHYENMISKNRTVELAKSLGYQYVDLSIWTGLHDQSDYKVNIKPFQYNFVFALLQKTFLGKPLIENYLAVKTKRRFIEATFRKLEEIPNQAGAKFVYAHIMVPHEPFVFNKDGGEYSFLIKSMQNNPKKLYLNQLQYTNRKIQSVISILLSKYNSLHPPIIIIQGDHGPRDMLSDVEQGERLRLNILNAYFLPGNGKDELYGSITPVNSFRLIFRHYFGLNFPPLEDKSYYQARDALNSPLKALDFGQ